MRASALRREAARPVVSLPDNDETFPPEPPGSFVASATAARFRELAIYLILTCGVFAAILAVATHVRVDLQGTTSFACLVALLLFASRRWSRQKGASRVADAFGAVATAGLGGMICGAVAMLVLRLHFPIADPMLRSFDLALGFDGLAILDWQLRHLWLFIPMRLAYIYTVKLFFAGMVVLALLGDRIEAWRAAFCFVGTLLTTCVISIVVPAKGLAVWAPVSILDRLPVGAMRSFWPRFDDFYSGADPILRVKILDGVISFPSFHAVVGFLTFAMWRKNIWTRVVAGSYLAVMLLSTLPGGGHYVVDLLAGFAVWSAWFLWSRHIELGIARQARQDLDRGAGAKLYAVR